MDREKLMEYLKRKESQMEECQHLFLKIKKGQRYYGFHSSDCGYDPCVVICLKCGLTNRFFEMDSIDEEIDKMARWCNPYYNGLVEVNDKIFRKQYGHAWRRGGKSFDDSVFNLISDEVWNVNSSMLLYKIAKSIKPDADDTEIFDTMKTLYEMETPEERLELSKIEQAQELINRYNNENMGLKYEKK